MTRHQLKMLLLSNHRAVERSIIALQHHPLGFDSLHQAEGLYYATEVANHRTLLSFHFKRARQIVLCYLDRLLTMIDWVVDAAPIHHRVKNNLQLGEVIFQADPFQQIKTLPLPKVNHDLVSRGY
jgi:hypothetical protein